MDDEVEKMKEEEVKTKGKVKWEEWWEDKEEGKKLRFIKAV